MERTKDSIEKSGPVFGFLSVTIAASAYITSIILFPGGYNFLKNMISELGVGPYGIIFNLGLILSGIVAIPYSLLGFHRNIPIITNSLNLLVPIR